MRVGVCVGTVKRVSSIHSSSHQYQHVNCRSSANHSKRFSILHVHDGTTSITVLQLANPEERPHLFIAAAAVGVINSECKTQYMSNMCTVNSTIIV
mmetsp:Transcript_3122/g.4668  ORF Transcript_3122/g.4668 Transcript_3122/m.4668 type:complete len:96 (+) Transcript_3122:1820-2107(+)